LGGGGETPRGLKIFDLYLRRPLFAGHF